MLNHMRDPKEWPKILLSHKGEKYNFTAGKRGRQHPEPNDQAQSCSGGTCQQDVPPDRMPHTRDIPAKSA